MMSDLDRAEARAIRDELCRRELVWYVRDCYPTLTLHPWQVDLCIRLQRWVEAIERGEGPRMMVHVPPQCGKSTIVARAFPAWIAGRHPEWPGIVASYGAGLANKHGRWIRNRLLSADHQRIFPASRLAPDSQAMDDMALTAGGQIISRGVGGSTTGNPAMWAVIDDPFADREQADSPTIRDNVDDWHSSTLTTRLGPGAGEILMHTRWHTDDLAGRLLERAGDGGDQWEVVCHPAERNGKWLKCRFSGDELIRKRDNMHPRDWAALYQQTPTVEGAGKLLDPALIAAGDPPPRDHLRVYLAWDPASSTKAHQNHDPQAWAVVGVDAQRRLWILHMAAERMDVLAACRRLLELWKHWKPDMTWIEGGPIGEAIRPTLEELQAKTAAWHPWEMVSHGRDKVAKARALEGAMAAGSVWRPRGDIAWWKPLELEMGRFDGQGTHHDDQVDALGIVCRQIRDMNTGAAPPPPEPEIPERSPRNLLAAARNRAKARARQDGRGGPRPLFAKS